MGTPIDLGKLRSLAVIGSRSGSTVREWRGDDGVRRKAVTDELGNTQTWHNIGDTERVDAHIKAPTVRVVQSVREERS